MSFDSVSFWILFLLIWCVYWFLPKKRQNWLLLIASLSFYSFWDVKFTLLLLATSFIDFCLAIAISKDNSAQRRKRLISLSVVLNLGWLFFFKYYLTWVNDPALGFAAWPQFKTIYEWGLPLGISFYTFQILSYTIDVYRGKIKATNSFSDFILFVSFFPQLVAGPIEKAHHLLPQIQIERKFNLEKIEQGFYLCLWGLFKKIYVANAIAHPIQSYFEQSRPVEASATILVFVLMTLQVYADFSGYSDIARGLGRMLGFELMINFKPFWFSLNPSDFWKRWNISLTRWLRDYVFLPLHKRNESMWLGYSKVLLVMMLVGVWHAPTLNWLLFGLFNGLVILIYMTFQKFKIFPKLFGFLLLLLLYVGNGMLHRTPTIAKLNDVFNSLLDWSSFAATRDLLVYASWFVVPMVLIESFVSFHDPEKDIIISKWPLKIAFSVFCLTAILFMERSTQLGFIYFQF